MNKKLEIFFLLFLIIILFFTRFYGNNYDAGLHLHPDERWLIMVAGKIHLFDQLNPDFFAYGSLPIYILKLAAQTTDYLLSTNFDSYDGLLVMGRWLVSISDISVGYLVFLISKKLTKNNKISLAAMLFYALSFFPIQNSNFFIVDNFVNFFTCLTVLALINFSQKPKNKNVILLGISYAALTSSKITSIVYLPVILLAIIGKSYFGKETKQLGFDWGRIKKALLNLFIFGVIATAFTFIFMPFTFLKYTQFLEEIKNQIRMNSDAYIFPYTLQYVETTPYAYYLKNIFLWGVGPMASLLACLGLLKIIRDQGKKIFKKQKLFSWLQSVLNSQLIVLVFFLIYFVLIGRSAIKFMRYMLPIYPFIAVLAAIGLNLIYQKIRAQVRWKKIILLSIFITQALWTLMLLGIYAQKHSRIQATEWMLKHIPAGSSLAVEHWDDRLPLRGGEKLQFIELPLYELPDDVTKWQAIDQKLQNADYIILASNRLFAPLPKLKDCNKYEKCYPKTAEYYEKLFSGKLGFIKIAEFTNRPKLFGFSIKDDNADESFTVYDHPKVIIFQNTNKTIVKN